MVLAVVVGRAVVVVGRAVTRSLDAITMQCKNCCQLFKGVECLLRPLNRFLKPHSDYPGTCCKKSESHTYGSDCRFFFALLLISDECVARQLRVSTERHSSSCTKEQV